MLNNRLDAEQFRRMIVAGANRLEANKKEVDELNVFPFRTEIRGQICL